MNEEAKLKKNARHRQYAKEMRRDPEKREKNVGRD
jgi:hypothetical protein